MKRWAAIVGIVAVSVAPLGADVTITHITSIEGGMVAAMQTAPPKMLMRIKGTRMRADVDVMGRTMTTITDVVSRQTIVLDPATKTAQVLTVDPAAAAAKVSKMDVSFQPTGASRTIDGAQCDEHTFTVKMDMSETGVAGQGGEAAAALKGVHMTVNGSMWLTKSGPGAADYIAMQKAALAANMPGVMTGMAKGADGGLEKLFEAATSVQGLPYLTEIITSFTGDSPVVAMMQQVGSMKITQKVTSVSTEAIPDDIFQVPADYKIEKNDAQIEKR